MPGQRHSQPTSTGGKICYVRANVYMNVCVWGGGEYYVCLSVSLHTHTHIIYKQIDVLVNERTEAISTATSFLFLLLLKQFFRAVKCFRQ